MKREIHFNGDIDLLNSITNADKNYVIKNSLLISLYY